MIRTDYEARNVLGVLLRTFGDLAQARRWVFEHAVEHDGLRVERVTTTIVREDAYVPRATRAQRPASHLRLVAR